MKKITILKTPKIPVAEENFIYNYYSENETKINDRKFVIYEGEENYYSIRTTDAREITPPRFISFSLQFYDVASYNFFERSEDRFYITQFPALLDELEKLKRFGNSLDNLFDLNKRRKYFNDINYLKQNQIFDTEIDLTLPEDTSEPYRQLVSFYDEEDPASIIPIASNLDYIESSIRNKETNARKRFKQYQKNGDSTLIDRSLYRRVKDSNKKIIHSYLEDKQAESTSNLGKILSHNNIKTLQEGVDSLLEDLNQNEVNFLNRAFQASRNPANFLLNLEENEVDPAVSSFLSKFEIDLENYKITNKILFDKQPKILLRTLDDFGDDKENFPELNEFVIGILIDKYELDINNNKNYLCSNFISIDTYKEQEAEIKDYAVNYGKTYIYEIRPVLLQSSVSIIGDTEIPSRIFYLILGNRTSSYAIKCIERESPLPAACLELNYDINLKGIELNWGLPANRQRDIVNFQIFRRESPFEPFKLIKEYRKKDVDVVDNSETGIETPESQLIEYSSFMKFNYLDKNIVNNKIYIYAVCCVDAHGLSSAYSAQVAGRYNGLTSRLEVDTISLAGALKQYPNQFFPRKTKFYDFENDIISNTPIIKNKSKMNIYFTPDYQTIIKGNENINIFEPVKSNTFTVSLTDANTLKSAQQFIYIDDRGI